MKIVKYKVPYCQPKLLSVISDDKVESLLQSIVDKIKNRYDSCSYRKATGVEIAIDDKNYNDNIYIIEGKFDNKEYSEDEYKVFIEFIDIELNSYEEELNKNYRELKDSFKEVLNGY